MDLIILFLLARVIGRAARRKGEKPGRWQWRLVLLWIGLEMVGFLTGYTINHNIALASLLGFALGIGSYLIVRSQLDALPDANG